MKAPLTLTQAEGYVRDVLAEMDAQGQGDALWVRLLKGRRIVGPLKLVGNRPIYTRFGTEGRVGSVFNNGDVWVWRLHSEAWSGPPEGVALSRSDGEAASPERADDALCAALRALGWHCMEAP